MAKLGLDSHPQKLLGICSPKRAHAILSAVLARLANGIARDNTDAS